MATTHEFASTGQAYDACQCRDDIKNGDTLVIASERVVGVAHTWPFAVTPEHGHLHALVANADLEAIESGFTAAVAQARQIASERGFV